MFVIGNRHIVCCIWWVICKAISVTGVMPVTNENLCPLLMTLFHIVYYSRYVPGLRSSNQIVKDFAKHISLPETEASPRVTIFAKSFFPCTPWRSSSPRATQKTIGKDFLGREPLFLRREPLAWLSTKNFFTWEHFFSSQQNKRKKSLSCLQTFSFLNIHWYETYAEIWHNFNFVS
jgi:hypothetical protein